MFQSLLALLILSQSLLDASWRPFCLEEDFTSLSRLHSSYVWDLCHLPWDPLATCGYLTLKFIKWNQITSPCQSLHHTGCGSRDQQLCIDGQQLSEGPSSQKIPLASFVSNLGRPVATSATFLSSFSVFYPAAAEEPDFISLILIPQDPSWVRE